MRSSLRSRFVISHVLPTVLVVPLLGLALIYVLETQVLLPNIANEVVGDANLIADLSMSGRESAWSSPSAAQAFVTQVGPDLTARLMLISTSGVLLASSDPADADRAGQRVDVANLSVALSGEAFATTTYSQSLGHDAYEVLIPARDAQGHVVGVVRLTHTYEGVDEQFVRLRFLILAVLAGGLLLGVGLGLELAFTLERPLRRLTGALASLTTGEQLTLIRERGPEEVELLVGAFNSLVERLNAVEESRRILLSSLVHELGRPLGALRSANQALLQGSDDDPALRHELLSGTEEELRHLERVLDDLAHLQGQLPAPLGLDRKPVALAEWLSCTLAPWRALATAKGLQWRTDVPEALPTLEVDPDRLAQALGNLLSNAIRYTPVGGEVAVDAALEGSMFVIRVRDSGPGVAPGERERIFGVFYRGSAGERSSQGMGMGLAIARDIVRAHGGSLGLERHAGSGATFVLRLPYRMAQPGTEGARVRRASSG